MFDWKMSMPPRFSRSSQRNSRMPAVGSQHSSSESVGQTETSMLPMPTRESGRRHSASASNHLPLRGMRRMEARRQMEESNFLSSKARIRDYNPPVDFRLLDYVVQYDDNLMCPICRCPFVDPVVLVECDHCFCRDCIRQSWSAVYSPHGPRGDCPSCRTPAKLGLRSATNKIIVNILDDLVVKCPHSDQGCKVEIKRGEVQDHVSIYCGYALVACPAVTCELPVRRKDASRGCLHFGVSCLDCHESLLVSHLEKHWRSECKDHKVTCDACKQRILSRELRQHAEDACPATSVPCPGQAYGCDVRSKRAQAESHAQTCTFARLAPVFDAQKQRTDEQATAQTLMTRKLEILENGFTAMQSILFTSKRDNPDEASAEENRLPFMQVDNEDGAEFPSPSTAETDDFHVPAASSISPLTRLPELSQAAMMPHDLSGTMLPNVNNMDYLATPFESTSSFPPPATNGGPYVSPLHHLLSMHESLRDEVSRISTALSELDGRHSMQNLNENLRTREEMSYLGAQLAGLSRQVHWLTSAHLQRQPQPSRGGTPLSNSAAGVGSSDVGSASAGASVEAAVSAVNTAATALRGAARVVNVGQGMRRGLSEEGRTKL